MNSLPAYILTAVAVLLVRQTIAARLVYGASMRRPGDINQKIDPTTRLKDRQWVKMSESPPHLVHQAPGTTLELECSAMGSPNPHIRWYRNNDLVETREGFDAALITTAVGLGTKISRLVVQNFDAHNQGEYVCRAQSGSHYASSKTQVVLMHDAEDQSVKEFMDTNEIPTHRPSTRIVEWNSVMMQPIGSTVVLPCKVQGEPKPEIFWVTGSDTTNEQLITEEDTRFKVLSSGELVIRSVNWADMGQYSCHAQNQHSKDSVSTFLYPVTNEE